MENERKTLPQAQISRRHDDNFQLVRLKQQGH